MIHKVTCAYQGVRRVNFPENLPYALDGWCIYLSALFHLKTEVWILSKKCCHMICNSGWKQIVLKKCLDFSV